MTLVAVCTIIKLLVIREQDCRNTVEGELVCFSAVKVIMHFGSPPPGLFALAK